MIPEDDVIEGVEYLRELGRTLGYSPNYFECATFLAFLYFKKQQVDVAVIEAGLGGKWDTTNILTPLLSIITSISYDHQDFLGTTLSEIASHKAGIIKPRIPVVIGPKARHSEVIATAKSLETPLEEVVEERVFYDEENREIAKRALLCLQRHFSIPLSALSYGLSQRPLCRFEQVGDVVFDVAHNPDGFSCLAQALKLHYPSRTFRFVVGMSQDKDLRECLQILANFKAEIHLVSAATKRAAPISLLVDCLQQTQVSYHIAPTLSEGVKQADALAKKRGEVLVICGSFYIMKSAKEVLQLL